MDVGEIIAIAISAVVAGGAFLGTRTERGTKVAEVAMKLVEPLEKQQSRNMEKIARLECCLRRHGIDPDQCVGGESRDG